MKKNKQNNGFANRKKNRGGETIPWHPAFVQALQLELKDYRDVLEFHTEFQLTSDPLRIDCVVVKKTKDVEIRKNIAVIFKTWNILEYKSPDDYVSIASFYKVYGYACLCTSLNNIPVTDLTITFVESRYPRELIKHLKEIRGYTVEKTGSGIYNVSGDILPIQIIDSRKLSAEDNLWLKNLSNRLNCSEIDLLITESARQDKSVQVTAYMYAIVHANTKILEDTTKMRKNDLASLYKTFEEVGLTAMWEAKGEARGEARGKEQEREKWQTVVADKDEKIAVKDAEIVRLRKQLEKIKK